MARLSIRRAWGDAFGLLRERPGAVLIWGLLLAAPSMAMIPVWPQTIATLASITDAEALAALNHDPDFQRIQAASNALSFLSMGVALVVWCAVFRSILRPRERNWASLRVSSAEGVTLVAAVLVILAAYGCLVVMAIIALTAGVLATLPFPGASSALAALTTVFAVAPLAVALPVFARLSLIPVVSFRDRRLAWGQGWRLGKGRTGALTALMVSTWLGYWLLMIVSWGFAVAALCLTTGSGPVVIVRAIMENPDGWLRAHPSAPFLLIIPGLLVSVFGSVLMAAPYASAVRQLSPAVSPDDAAA